MNWECSAQVCCAALHRAQLLPFVRDSISNFKGRIIGAPVSLDLPYMFYRADVFRAHNLTVPDTWDQLLLLAERLNGTVGVGTSNCNPYVCIAHRMSSRV